MPEFSIGIDLGTTNCALAFVSLKDTAACSEILPVAQRDSLQTLVERSTLPSFLYLPTSPEADRLEPSDPGIIDGWITGLMARRQTATTPERVVHSAKSWLANHAVDPAAPLLPWKSGAVDGSSRISPQAASAAFLTHLRLAWDQRFALDDARNRFDRQSVTLTVPASFDAAAQAATLDAARMAGFPADVRLLEEPQAALYRYLEAVNKSAQPELQPGRRILVIDVGGGTSDFSLFSIGEMDTSGRPRIERVAVSEHILLGGDNIDLALAHVLESELVPEGGELTGDSWSHLLARARELKERCLGDGFSEDEELNVSIPGRGSGLLAGTLSASLPAAQLREILLEGFFPACERESRPARARSALREWGLPYAADFAVTRYLADFLRDQPPVDAVLFNGGTLSAARIQKRLLGQLAAWQNARRPAILGNTETDLAVARGAAHYGALLTRRSARIEAGAARAVFLEVAGPDEPATPQLLCVLPRGAPPEEPFVTQVPGLRLQVNREVRFQAFQGAHHHAESAGTLVGWDVDWDTSGFSPLPPLETRVEAAIEDGHDTLSVQLESRLNELGLLQIELVSGEFRWPLVFNLRHEQTPLPAVPVKGDSIDSAPRVDEGRLEKAAAQLRRDQASGQRRTDTTAGSVLRELERTLGEPKHAWSLPIVRRLADELLKTPDKGFGAPDQRGVWLYLAGFFMRPGFGDPADPGRLDRLWQAAPPAALRKSEKRLQIQVLILWRRLAAGLSRERQEALLSACKPALQDPRKSTAEHVRLAGALEILDADQKERLVQLFTDRVLGHADSGHAAPYLRSLGHLLSRIPFHGDDGTVLPPAVVESVFQRLKSLDWKAPEHREIVSLFLRAARQVENPGLNLPPRASRKIADRLEKSGVAAARLAPLRSFVRLSGEDRAELYSESLPAGLSLA